MISVIPGGPEHAAEMHTIEAESFAEAWSELSIKYELMEKHTICFLAVDESGTILGHAYMRHIINEGHINNIAVRFSHRRRGIGSILVEALLTAACEREMIGLTLEVRVSNTAAISLYKKHGFKAEGIRKSYYTRPTEDGIVMWRHMVLPSC